MFMKRFCLELYFESNPLKYEVLKHEERMKFKMVNEADKIVCLFFCQR